MENTGITRRNFILGALAFGLFPWLSSCNYGIKEGNISREMKKRLHDISERTNIPFSGDIYGIRVLGGIKRMEEVPENETVPIPYSGEEFADVETMRKKIEQYFEATNLKEKFSIDTSEYLIQISSDKFPSPYKFPAMWDLKPYPVLSKASFIADEERGENMAFLTFFGYVKANKKDRSGKILRERYAPYQLVISDMDKDGKIDLIHFIVVPEFSEHYFNSEERRINYDEESQTLKVPNFFITFSTTYFPVLPAYYNYTQEEDENDEYFSKLNFRNLEELEANYRPQELHTGLEKTKFELVPLEGSSSRTGKSIFLKNNRLDELIASGKIPEENIGAIISQFQDYKSYISLSNQGISDQNVSSWILYDFSDGPMKLGEFDFLGRGYLEEGITTTLKEEYLGIDDVPELSKIESESLLKVKEFLEGKIEL